MKIKELLLDFTPLLDVIMIILFFFILNYHNQTVELQSKANSELSEAASLSSELDSQIQANEQEMETWREEATAQMQQWENEFNEKMEMLENSDEEAASAIQALLDFQSGASIEINLAVIDEENWSINIKSGDHSIGAIPLGDKYNINSFKKDQEQRNKAAIQISQDIIDIFESNGLETDNTIIGTFLYDGNTNWAYYPKNILLEAIAKVRKKYNRFYCLNIDKTDNGEEYE